MQQSNYFLNEADRSLLNPPSCSLFLQMISYQLNICILQLQGLYWQKGNVKNGKTNVMSFIEDPQILIFFVH